MQIHVCVCMNVWESTQFYVYIYIVILSKAIRSKPRVKNAAVGEFCSELHDWMLWILCAQNSESNVFLSSQSNTGLNKNDSPTFLFSKHPFVDFSPLLKMTFNQAKAVFVRAGGRAKTHQSYSKHHKNKSLIFIGLMIYLFY